ncbi:hypothetical protein BZA05DRAFT_402175 [Tricharina praecox]|uniref:uncharacterized protein n=1 Tax=Tricharina praecox TaxID=43433 RepID=UPI00221F9DBD|nr:uncharacterized protein BZA05DRAFT_402175 [Tricharina praecox]KAI5849091.1 hypothetical protein BZA05DRAFT_402175 [Tricharina praecox]
MSPLLVFSPLLLSVWFWVRGLDGWMDGIRVRTRRSVSVVGWMVYEWGRLSELFFRKRPVGGGGGGILLVDGNERTGMGSVEGGKWDTEREEMGYGTV